MYAFIDVSNVVFSNYFEVNGNFSHQGVGWSTVKMRVGVSKKSEMGNKFSIN